SDSGLLIEMGLNERVEIWFRISTHSANHQQLSAVLRVLGKQVLARAPEFLLAGVDPVGRLTQVGGAVKTSGALARRYGRNFFDAGGAQMLSHVVGNRPAKHVHSRNRTVRDALTLAAGSANQQDCSYIHASHLGAAARK